MFLGPAGPIGPQGIVASTGPQGIPGPIGAQGVTGAKEVVGSIGATGPAGVTGPNPYTTAAFAANTSGTLLTVLVAGTSVPLPNAQSMSPDITLTSNTTFTVNTTGYYRISYHLNTTASLLIGTCLIVNGAAIPASVIPPIVSTSSYRNEVELYINSGSTILLQVYATLLGVATLLSNSAGASLMILRLS
mgnify:CR=1 FL=1